MALLGYTKTCGAQSGGGQGLYLAKSSDVTSFTLTDKVYSAVTMSAAEVFAKYDFERDSANLKFDDVRENMAFKSTATIEINLGKVNPATRDALEEIANNSDCGMIGIFVDNNGNKWVLGYTEKHKKARPLELATNAGDTGKALTDANQNILVLTCDAGEKFRTFSGEIPLAA